MSSANDTNMHDRPGNSKYDGDLTSPKSVYDPSALRNQELTPDSMLMEEEYRSEEEELSREVDQLMRKNHHFTPQPDYSSIPPNHSSTTGDFPSCSYQQYSYERGRDKKMHPEEQPTSYVARVAQDSLQTG